MCLGTIVGSYKEHQNILKEFKVMACQEFPEMRLFDRHVGLFVLIRFFKDLKNRICKISDWKKYLVKINQKGMADVYAIYPTKHGLIHIEIEVKSGNARQSKSQKKWQQFIESKKGIYILVRNPKNGIEELRKKIGSQN